MLGFELKMAAYNNCVIKYSVQGERGDPGLPGQSGDTGKPVILQCHNDVIIFNH